MKRLKQNMETQNNNLEMGLCRLCKKEYPVDMILGGHVCEFCQEDIDEINREKEHGHHGD